MFAITMNNGTICTAIRVVGVLSAHDDEGAKTYYVAQVDGAKRRLEPRDVAKIEMLVA